MRDFFCSIYDGLKDSCRTAYVPLLLEHPIGTYMESINPFFFRYPLFFRTQWNDNVLTLFQSALLKNLHLEKYVAIYDAVIAASAGRDAEREQSISNDQFNITKLAEVFVDKSATQQLASIRESGARIIRMFAFDEKANLILC